MIKYMRIVAAAMGEVWAVDRTKMQAVIAVLAFQAAGRKLSDPEIAARVPDKRAQEIVKAPGQVAVLPVYGLLAQRINMMDDISGGGTSVELLSAQFRGLLADDQIKAVILNFDSPGGVSYGIAEFAAEILAARGDKPIIAQVDSMAASAAYWLASAADEVVLTPGGLVGSIGVYALHEEFSKALENEGITTTLVSSGGIKGKINDFMPLSEEGLAEIRKRVDFVDAQFVRAVALNRGIAMSAVKDQFGSGEMFMGNDALKRGMVDRIAPLSETLARFGAAAPAIGRRKAVSAMRTAALAQDYSAISPSVVEDAMREALGFSKTQAAAIAGHSLKILRGGERREDRGDPGAEAKPSSAARNLIDAIRASTGGKL